MSKLILIADDDENDTVATLAALKKAGVKNRIVTVGDGDQVIAYLAGDGKFENREKFPIPSILLLDLKMPRLTGFEVLDWLRGTRFKNILTVVLSGHGELKNVQRAYEMGARSFLVKPVEEDEIQNLIRGYSIYWELGKGGAGGKTNERRAPLSL